MAHARKVAATKTSYQAHHCPECKSTDLDLYQRDGQLRSAKCKNCSNYFSLQPPSETRTSRLVGLGAATAHRTGRKASTETTVKCDRCGGTGLYAWGPIVNGKPTHTGPCFRCEGKGFQTEADKRRNWGYDMNAVKAA